MKKVICFFLCLLTFASIAPNPVQAEEEADDSDLVDYLQDLHQANQRWQDRLAAYLTEDFPSFDEIQAAELPGEDLHPAIQALDRQFKETFTNYLSDEHQISPMREIYSDTFVLEKMLLPEFRSEDLDALDSLRECLTAAVYQAYEIRSHDGFVTSAPAYEGLDFLKQLEDVSHMSDSVFDQSNRIAMTTGIASEAYSTMLNRHDIMDPDFLVKGDIFHHSINPHVADVSSSRNQVYDYETNEVYQGIPLSGPMELYPPLDYRTRYGLDITNHYPAPDPSLQAQEVPANIPDWAAWSSDQAYALDQAVHIWGQSMGQAYQAYRLEDPVHFYGDDLPQESFTILLDGEERQAHYLTEGVAGELIVLAVYSDIIDTMNPDPERHLYLMVEDQGQPRVLITMEGPNDQGIFSFTDTANQDLLHSFISIYE